MPPEEDVKPLTFCTAQWFLYFSAVLFHRCAIYSLFEVFVSLEKFLIEGLVGRNLSELLHASRQEQEIPRAADVLWKGRSELRRAALGEMSIRHTQLECWEKFQMSCFHFFDNVWWKHRALVSVINGNCLIIKCEIKFSPLLRGSTAHTELTSYLEVKNENSSIRILKKTLQSG